MASLRRKKFGTCKSALIDALATRFKSASEHDIKSAAREIDFAIRDLARRQSSVKVLKSRPTKSSPVGAMRYKTVKQTSTASRSLARLKTVARNYSADRDNYVWVRAWQEAHPDAMGFIVEAAGGYEAFGVLPTCQFERAALDTEYTPDELAALINGTRRPTAKRVVPLSFPVPSPTAILPLLPAAEVAAAKNPRSKWSRDLAAARILRAFSTLLGRSLVQPSGLAVEGVRKGAATEFLLLVEKIYKTKFFRELLRSGAGISRVIQLSR